MWQNTHNKPVEVWYFVEVVNDFVDGRLGINKHAMRAVVHMVSCLEALLALPGAKVVETNWGAIIETEDRIYAIIFQLDEHAATEEEYLASNEGKYFPYPHSLTGDPGMESVDEMQPFKKCAYIVVTKPFIFDPITVKTLKDVVKRIGKIVKIRFFGFLTSMCVLGAAVMARANFQDAEIVIDAKGTADTSTLAHGTALEILERNFMTIINR